MRGKRESGKIACGKCERSGLILRFRSWLQTIPHLFAKVTIIWCILCGTVASAYALRILSRTGHDPAALLGVILAFFGGELLMLLFKTVLGRK